MPTALAALFGLLTGSFLNVCIHRIPKGETVVSTPSHCTACGGRIAWYDLVPLLSWALLRGKCRRCAAPISPRYPLVEAANALLWGALFWRFGPSAQFALYALLSSALLVISVIDLDTFTIPDKILLFLLIFAVVSAIIDLDIRKMGWHVLGFAVVSVPLLLLSMASKGGIGGGDIKLMAVCGLYIGAGLIGVAFFLGVVCAGVVSSVLLLTGRKKKGEIIPLGPFLSFGIVLSLFVGDKLAAWYLSFF